MADVGAVILAAGEGTRFGIPKARVTLGAATLLERAVATVDAMELAPIVAVVPRNVDPPSPARGLVNDRPADGLSRSLRLGIAAMPAEAEAALVLLVDQPTVGGGLLWRLLDARGDRAIVATTAAGVTAPPLLLERSAFALVDGLTGDRGLRDVLAANPDLVTPIEVGSLPRDVDTPLDLAALGEACPGCDALLPAQAGPTHAYIGSSPACWAAYGELLAREFSVPAYGVLHRHTADVYAAQHPGVDGRRQRQSVALHLIALCQWLEHAASGEHLNPITQRLASGGIEWPWLTPPKAYGMTVLDVLGADDAEANARLVRRWAESVWRAWSTHHALVRRWAVEALAGGG